MWSIKIQMIPEGSRLDTPQMVIRRDILAGWFSVSLCDTSVSKIKLELELIERKTLQKCRSMKLMSPHRQNLKRTALILFHKIRLNNNKD